MASSETSTLKAIKVLTISQVIGYVKVLKHYSEKDSKTGDNFLNFTTI